MAITGLISILMRTDTKPLAKGAKDAQGILRQLSSQMRLMNAVQIGGMAFNALASGASAATGFISQLVNAASDLNEQLSATEATFGASGDTVTAAAQQQAKAFGIVKSEYLEAANGLGAIFKASGLTEQAAASMSVQFTNLATDLSSFRNLDFGTALEKIRAGLVGEAEPLRTVGVLLSDATVKTEAYRSGLARTGAELTEAQKVQARAAIIARQLSDANGDLARTAAGPANAMRAIQGRAVNMAADFGRAIQPITQFLLGGLNLALASLGGYIDSNTKSIGEWAAKSVQAGGVVNNALLAVGSGLASAIDGTLKAVQVFSNILNVTIQGLAQALSFIFGSLVTDAAAAFDKINEKLQNVRAPGKQVEAFFGQVAKGAANFGAVDAQAKGAAAVTDQVASTSAEVDTLNKKLDDQLKYFGLIGEAAELAKLKAAGASSEQLQGAAEKTMQLKELENAQSLAKLRTDAIDERMKNPLAGLATGGSREFFNAELQARTGQGSQDANKDIAKNTRETNLLLTQLKALLAGRPASGTELAMVP